MKFNSKRYQHGSVRAVPFARGFTREFRLYITALGGKRKLKIQLGQGRRILVAIRDGGIIGCDEVMIHSCPNLPQAS